MHSDIFSFKIEIDEIERDDSLKQLILYSPVKDLNRAKVPAR